VDQKVEESVEQQSTKKLMMQFLWLIVIEEYNNHMNGMDIANQLRGSNWPDRCMGQQKW
jgi:hypothetical protein